MKPNKQLHLFPWYQRVFKGKGKLAFFALIQTNLPVWSFVRVCRKNTVKRFLKCFACFIKAAPFKEEEKRGGFQVPCRYVTHEICRCYCYAFEMCYWVSESICVSVWILFILFGPFSGKWSMKLRIRHTHPDILSSETQKKDQRTLPENLSTK